MRPLKIALKTRVGSGRENVLVSAIARKCAESVHRHVGELDWLWFIVLRLPYVNAGIPGIDVDVASPAAQDLSFPHPGRRREYEERLQLEIAPLITDADHLNNLLGLWKSVAARRLLLLRNDADWVLVVFFEADGVVEYTAKWSSGKARGMSAIQRK